MLRRETRRRLKSYPGRCLPGCEFLAEILQQTLNEEGDADKKLTSIAFKTE